MKNMTLKEITLACNGTYYGDDTSYHKNVASVVIDSRKVEKDSLFVAIRGKRVDGHTFIPETINAGALCAVSEELIDNANFPYIKVASTEQALKDIAEHYRQGFDLKVVGITGSVGKTSTKEMMASVLSQKYSVHKTPKNYNSEIGLSLTAFLIEEHHQVAVLEMGINDFGEMEHLSKIAKPDFCVMTNIGTAHIEFLKTRDGILKAKSEIFRFMNPKGKIFLNGNDDKLISLVPFNGISPTYYGMDSKFPFYATDINPLGLKGTTATYHTPKSSFTAHVNVPGAFMVYNALASIAVAYSLDMTDEDIIKGLEALKPIAGRSNIIESDKYTIIDDCYNAGPVTVKGALELLSQADTRKVAILGDMFELGPETWEIHFGLGAYAAESNIDVLICIGELSKQTYKGAKEHGFTKAYYFETKEDLFKEMDTLLELKDTILVKASNGMGFAKIVEVLKDI